MKMGDPGPPKKLRVSSFLLRTKHSKFIIDIAIDVSRSLFVIDSDSRGGVICHSLWVPSAAGRLLEVSRVWIPSRFHFSVKSK